MYGYDVIRDFFIKGGPVLWPLVACSLVSLTITIERMLFWWRMERRNRRGATALEDLFEHTEQGRFEQALDIGQSQDTAILRVLTAGLKHRNYGLAENMEIAANDEIARRLDTPRQIVSKWRKRFYEQRVVGLDERDRHGRPPTFSP